jgi:hypothetical protein
VRHGGAKVDGHANRQNKRPGIHGVEDRMRRREQLPRTMSIRSVFSLAKLEEAHMGCTVRV